jgi:BirA family biotin operon repressor/biotin-[acetyl-CoA-carboxylase] ligase
MSELLREFVDQVRTPEHSSQQSWSLVHVSACASTMDLARRLRRLGWGAGLCVLADRQSQGRGRRGRSFVSPTGGTYLTLLIDPPCDASQAWRAGIATALAVRDVLQPLVKHPIHVAWPNDLMQGERKIGGILLEWLQPPAGAELAIGIGLNTGPDPQLVAPEDAGPAGPLEFAATRAQLVSCVVREVRHRAASVGSDAAWQRIVDQMRCELQAHARKICWFEQPDGSRISGYAIDFGSDGSLTLRQGDGSEILVRYAHRVVDPTRENRA